MIMRHSDILSRDRTALVLIDLQEKLLPAMFNADDIIEMLLPVISVAKDFKLATILTEQNPSGIGRTDARLRKAMPDYEPVEKLCFSCFGNLDFVQRLEHYSPRTLVLAGIETHICVEQTALDALERGFFVQVMADACGSRRELHHDIALKKVRDAGAILTTSETVIFELLEKAGTSQFKNILGMIK